MEEHAYGKDQETYDAECAAIARRALRVGHDHRKQQWVSLILPRNSLAFLGLYTERVMDCGKPNNDLRSTGLRTGGDHLSTHISIKEAQQRRRQSKVEKMPCRK